MLSDVQSSNPTKISLNIITATTTIFITRMHSSRMRTARSSSRQVGEGVLPQCMLGYPPQVWAWRPPWVWAWSPPQVWAWSPSPGQTPQVPPWVSAWKPARHAGIHPPLQRPARHAGIPPARHAGIPRPPPVDRQTRVKT